MKRIFQSITTLAVVAAMCLVPLVGHAHAAPAVKNGRIVFSRLTNGVSQVFTITSSGGGVKQLTFGSGGGTTPSWSSDGAFIAYTSGSSLYFMKANGNAQTRITPPGLVAELATWSPDGTKLAFVSDDDEIYVINRDGSNLQQLTNSTNVNVSNIYPAWSPDGTKILFLNIDDDPNTGAVWSLMTVAPDGTGTNVLYQNSGGDVTMGRPDWSPDGSQIVFNMATDNQNGDTIFGIHVINADGTGLTQIYATTYPIENLYPAWSPKGDKVVFASGDFTLVPRHYYLYTMNPDGSQVVQLTSGQVNDLSPDW